MHGNHRSCIGQMEALYLFATVAGLSRFAVDGRAVNISTSWFLPEEGSPVFYRYFDDKVTWNQAHAACGSHHADLLSMQTSAQTDMARAYLREIDVVDNLWIGLQRESPEESFSWTNGEKLLGDGYWVEPIPKSSHKLCVAIDPEVDFRWSSHYCKGPEEASFVCELPVPEWAKKENGCLMSPLPSLTVTLIPDAAMIQLLSDCGLDGTRRIACNEKTNLEEIIKHLTCDAFTGSTTGGETRQVNNRLNPHDTTRTYHPLTRHRRSASSISATTPNRPPLNETISAPITPSHHLFPRSPYLAFDRNAPTTQQSRPPPRPDSNDTPFIYKPLPGLLITDDDPPPDNGSLPSPSLDDSPIVLMIDDKNLNGPFPFPLDNDIIINNPSLSPLQIISVDLEEVDNLTAGNTDNLTTPLTFPEPLAPAPIRLLHSHLPHLPKTPRHSTGNAGEEPLNTEKAKDKTGVPQRPSRGRLFKHLTRSSYPRLLNSMLG